MSSYGVAADETDQPTEGEAPGGATRLKCDEHLSPRCGFKQKPGQLFAIEMVEEQVAYPYARRAFRLLFQPIEDVSLLGLEPPAHGGKGGASRGGYKGLAIKNRCVDG